MIARSRRKKRGLDPVAVRRRTRALVRANIAMDKRMKELEQDHRNLAVAFIGFSKVVQAHRHWDIDLDDADMRTTMPLFDEEEAEARWKEEFG